MQRSDGGISDQLGTRYDNPYDVLYARQIVTPNAGVSFVGIHQSNSATCSGRFRAQGGNGANACISIECGPFPAVSGQTSGGGFTIGPWGSGRGAGGWWSAWDTSGSFVMHQSAFPNAVVRPNSTGGLYIGTSQPTSVQLGKIWINGSNLCVGTGNNTFKQVGLN